MRTSVSVTEERLTAATPAKRRALVDRRDERLGLAGVEGEAASPSAAGLRRGLALDDRAARLIGMAESHPQTWR